MLTTLVRYINVSIAVLALLAVGLAYWFVIRPLPRMSGDIVAPIREEGLIKRDARGVPHIEAQSLEDAFFLQGYATAQDRLWQIDSLRRFARGQLSEVFGSGTLHTDELSRRMRIGALADIDASQLRGDNRRIFAAYARGINAVIDGQRGRYQVEFNLPGHAYSPRPWSIADSIAVGLVMFRNMTDEISTVVDRAALQSVAKGASKLNLLIPPALGGALPAGSNNWAVSGAHTVDGKPILENDTHLDYSIPSPWHMVHLKAPGLNVTGCTLPGVPGVIIGHNEQIAWGVTNFGADVMDLYSEDLNGRTGQYAFEGHVQQAQLDTEFIGVRDGKPQMLKVWVTRHGPVVFSDASHNLAMRWSASEGFGYPFLAIAKASNWQEFRAALSDFWGPAQNFAYADKAGNIGYQGAGRIPVRHGFHGNLPLNGASGQFEWDGYIPFEQMPTSYNPPSGIIATANQNPFAPDQPVDGGFADPDRVRQIRARLTAKSKLDADDMLAIAKDVYSSYDGFLARRIVAAVNKGHGTSDSILEAVEVLKKWNGQMDRDGAAPLITQMVSNQMRRWMILSVLSNSVGPKFVPPLLPRPSVIRRMLREQPSGWVPNDDWDAWVLARLTDGLAEGRKLQGSPISKWRWGKTLVWNLEHPVGKQLPFVSGFFDIGPIGMSGSETTVKQTTLTKGPSERIVVEFGSLDKSDANLTTGESGHVASPNYKDEWPSYYVGNSFPMQFQYVDAKETLRIKPETSLK